MRKIHSNSHFKTLIVALTVFSSLTFSTPQKIEAANFNSLSSIDKTVFTKVAGDTNNIINISSNISTSIEGKNNISGYQWTAWYDQNNKNFNINKSQTNGNYNVGVPTKTGGNQINANMTKAGYYKYLSDPVYSEIRLKANQTFNWTKQWTETKTDEKKSTIIYNNVTASNPNRKDNIRVNFRRYYIEQLKYSANSIEYGKTQFDKTLKWSDDAHDKGTASASFKNKNKETTIKCAIKKQSVQGGYKIYKMTFTKTEKTTVSTTHKKNHSATIEIANTVVAQNVSATELSKYKSFTLKSKNGGTGAVNTQVVKSNGGWWGSNHPAYHQGNNTTTDANGTYYYWSNSGSGSNGVNLRNVIPIKEKLYSFAGIPTNLGKDNKYTLTINPNGGEYNGNPGITSIKQLIGTSYTVNTPSRDGYILSGWEFSGSGTWNPNNQKYTFGTGDGSLTAKWIAKTPETDPNNPDNTNKKYTLTIDPNGGKYNNKTTPTTITKKIGDSESIKNPKRSDYIFLGWKVVSGDSNCFSQGTSSSMYRFYSDATLQAQWIKKGQSNSGTVIIDPNGGNYDGSTNKVTISGNAGSTTTIKTPVKDGYIFKGWEVINIEKNKFNGNTFTFIQGTTTLKAKWEIIKIDPCIVNGTGVDACGTNQDSMPGTWVHLSKDIY